METYPLVHDQCPLTRKTDVVVSCCGKGRGKRKTLHRLAVDLEKTNVDDAALAARLVRGQHDTIQVLVERYQDHVFRIARRWLGDYGEAKDMVQSVFLEAFRNIAAFDPQRGSFKTWLLSIAHNRTINRRQYLEARGFFKSTALLEDILDRSTDLGQNRLGLLPPELSRLTTELLTLLEPRERNVITLTYHHGLTREQVAVDLGVTVAAVRHSLQKGLKILYSAITECGSTRTAGDDIEGKDTSID